MRRLLLVLGIALSAPPLLAQSAQVSLSMSLDTANSRTGSRRPVVYLRNLLLDSRWYEPLDNALPLIVSYDLKLWRSRDGWIDEFVTTYTWETIVSKEPLQEEYSVTLVINNQIRRPVRFGVRDSANLYLNRALQIDVIPPRAGRFYYTLDARITALSDRDMDRLERFLAGDPDPDGPGRGSVVGRGLRRALLKLAGLPSQILTARTEVFELVAQEDD
jgi:hypothetical protein